MTSGTTTPGLSVVAAHGTAGPTQDRELAGIIRLAAELCGARSAAVTLLDDGRPPAPADPGPAPLLGAVALESDPPGSDPPGPDPPGSARPGSTVGRLIVPDARADARFASNPYVTGERGAVRFSAASPLRSPEAGLLGVLCVFDDEVRTLDDRQSAALDELADQVTQVLDLRGRESRLLDAVGQLLRTNDELGAFAGKVAHDLRAPLTAVLGFLALADGPFRDEMSERAGECVGSALDAARRMRTLIDDLLAYATFAAQPQARPVGLPGLVVEVVADLDDGIGRAGATVTYAGLDEVVGDPTLLRQLLQNLVANAVKHAGPSPAIRVSAVEDGPRWHLEVADDGPGIPPEQRLRVFDPFVRLTATGGSGIGLATCARIVEALGGTIMVDEAPGGGAAFRATLP